MSSISVERLNAALEGRYAIQSEIGSGGMATVFLAHDVRHDRSVALKVLRPELAAVMGAERFLAEIRTTANLQHPHILALFDSGEADGFLFFVMPFVKGETLRDLIDREKQLPVDQAVSIGAKVAQALDYAHRHGVVHRDIKPANILLHDGEPVVADFGIALAVQEAGGGRMTETGLSLGTPYYMSPEQATGDRVPDARSDVYSLGSVLYEMLTGEPPFQGTTAQSVLGKILTSDAKPPTEVRPSLPPHVASVVMKALERLPADRFATAGEVSVALGDRSFRHGQAAVDAAPAGDSVPKVWRVLSFVSTATALVLAAALLFRGGGAVGSGEPLSLAIPIPESAALLTPDGGPSIQVSEDGSTIAYVGLSGGGRQLFVRNRGDLEPRPIPNTEGARFFFISPTGEEIAFIAGADQTLRSVLVETGAVRMVADSVVEYSGHWTEEGWIYFQNSASGISRIREEGGEAERITGMEGSPVGSQAWIDVLPGGEAALISIWGATAASDSIGVVDLETGEIRVFWSGVVAKYSHSEHVVFATSQGQIMAAPFDVGRLEPTGPALPMLEGVRTGVSGEAEFSLSRTGALVYRAGSAGGDAQLVWLERNGTRELVDSTFVGILSDPALSPDGGRAAFIQVTNGRPDLWIKRLGPNSPPQRLTATGEGDDIRRPAWSPDGDLIYYVASRGRSSLIMARRADGTGAVTELYSSESTLVNEVTVSPDGEWLVVRHGANPATRDLFAHRIVGDSIDPTAVPLVTSEFDERAPSLSPEGRWLTYVSNQSGRSDIYVRPYPDASAGVWRITSQGADEPRWGRDSTELFYKTSTRTMVRVELDYSAGIAVTDRQELFDAREYSEDASHWQYDVDPRTGRILTIWREDDGRAPLVWIENFDVELERRFAGTGGR